MEPGRRPPLAFLLAALLAVLALALLVAVSLGSQSLGARRALDLLLQGDDGSAEAAIVLGFRLPRVLLAAAVGGLLGVSGVLLQGALRNRLAEPLTVGTASGALLGAALAVVLEPDTLRTGLMPEPEVRARLWTITVAAAVAGAACVTWLVVQVSHRAGRAAVGPVLLAGFAVNALVGALVALLLYLGSQGQQTAATLIAGWTHGGRIAETAAASWIVPATIGVAAVAASLPLARPLDALLLGEEEAAASGIDVVATRRWSLGIASVAAGTAVAVAGLVAFVGLLAPRLVARWTGPMTSRRVPAAFVTGAILVVLAEALGRSIARGSELPPGILLATVGAPVLLFLIARELAEARS